MRVQVLVFGLLLGSLLASVHAFRGKLPSWSTISTVNLGLRCIVKDDVNAVPDSKRRLSDVCSRLEENLSPNVVNFPMLLGSMKDLELTTSQPNFWDDPAEAQVVVAEQNRVKAMVERIETWKTTVEDIGSLIDFASQEDASLASKIETTPLPLTPLPLRTHFTRPQP